MKKRLTLSCLLASSIASASFAQSGPAGVDNSTNNAFWVKADGGTSTKVDGNPLSSWTDESGNGNTVTAPSVAQQPIYRASFINGFPAIQFDNNSTAGQNDYLTAPDAPELDNSAGFTLFSVVRTNSTNSNARSIYSKRTNVGVNQAIMFFLFANNRLTLDVVTNNNRFDTNPTAVVAGSNTIATATYDGTLAAANRSKIYSGQTLLRTSTENDATMPDYASPLIIGATHVGDNRAFDGYIAEIIYYRRILNTTEKIVVDNYLSSKYDIGLSTNDFYAGDTPANGNFDREVAGIGQFSGSDNHQEFFPSVSGGIGMRYNSGYDNGDYVFLGHNLVTNAGNTLDVNVTSGGPIDLRWERIWYIDVTNTGTGINTTLTFDISDGGMGASVVVGATSDYKLLYRAVNSGAWTIVANAASAAGDQITFSYDFNSNAEDGFYTIGTLNQFSSPLPVTLVSFEGEPINNAVQLKWTTASELNNDYFELEHSADGINFTKFTSLNGAGNSNQQKNYSAFHENPVLGKNYYRLVQVDFDGTKSVEGRIVVEMLPENEIQIFPNPSHDIITIGQVPEGVTAIRCYDAAGKLVLTKEIVAINSVQLTISSLAPGNYILKCIDKDGTIMGTQKLIKTSK
jgi:hypothetical protein